VDLLRLRDATEANSVRETQRKSSTYQGNRLVVLVSLIDQAALSVRKPVPVHPTALTPSDPGSGIKRTEIWVLFTVDLYPVMLGTLDLVGWEFGWEL
jgi:hypothetical protein